jgi:hypothetical protein
VSDDFLLCRRCGTLHPVSAQPLTDEDVQEFAEFRAEHEAHGLEEAVLVSDSLHYEGPTWDPMTIRWFRVQTAGDQLQVRSWRTSIDEPRCHQVTCPLPPTADLVEVDRALLRRAFDRHFYPQAMRPAKVERFAGAVDELVADLDPATVVIAFDDVDVPNASLGPFPTELCDVLLSRCAQFLDAWELEHARRFIADHRGPDGALAVRVRRVLHRSAA